MSAELIDKEIPQLWRMVHARMYWKGVIAYAAHIGESTDFGTLYRHWRRGCGAVAWLTLWGYPDFTDLEDGVIVLENSAEILPFRNFLEVVRRVRDKRLETFHGIRN